MIYIFGILVKRAISSASLTVLAYVLVFDDFWFIRIPMEPERDIPQYIFLIVSEHKRQNGLKTFFFKTLC